MQRLVALEQHVVGHVDHVADRPHARLHEALRHPRGRRPERDARHATEVAGAAHVVVDHHTDLAGDVARDGSVRLRQVEGQREVGGELTRHAGDAHGVGTVGGDRQVEDDVVEAEHATHVGAERGRLVETEDAAVVVAEAELLGGAEHAVGHDAADLAPLEHETAGEGRSGAGVGHDHARHHVGRAAHHAGLTAAGVDVDELQLVGVGVLLDTDHARDLHAGDLGAGLLHALHLEAELVERGHEIGDRRVDRGEVADPGKRYQHRISCPSTARGSACRRRRRS